MASLHKKVTNGHPYWYIVQSRRVNGKPRPIVLKYLGKADDLLRKLESPTGKPKEVEDLQFGAAAALLDLATELNLVAIIDKQAPKRSQGLSVGQYLLLAAINRCVAPCSKSSMAEWYAQTSLKRLLPTSQKALAPQRFWDHMGYLTQERVRAIEEELTQHLVQHFQIDLKALLFDATNFDTFIDSTNPSELAQRGKAKSKRTDLRLVSLALMVSADFGIPLFSHVYSGNQPDSVTFSDLIEPLAERYRRLATGAQHVTMVFDKGNNSADNIMELAETPYHFIGSLVPSQHADLLEIPLDQFTPLQEPRLEGVCAHRTKKNVYGEEYAIVITRSPGLLQGQLRGIEQHLKKKLHNTRSLQYKVRKSQLPGAKGKGYTRESLEKQCEKLAKGQYIHEFFRVFVEERTGKRCVRYRIDGQAFEELKVRQLGKTIIFTDNHDWATDDIVLGYRGQYQVENAFRQMKDPHWVTFSPMFHWTDDKIRVHAFYCVLGLTLAALLERQLAKANIHLSIDRTLEALTNTKEMLVLYPNSDPSTGRIRPGRPRVERVLSKLNKTQQRLYDTLQLGRFFPAT